MNDSYPKPINDWTKADQYPASADLDINEWAWEFLRRNPEYQRLYDLFESLPDEMILKDGSSSVKTGKYKGTAWLGMRFLTGDSAFYADPPPIQGESMDEYYERTDGHIMRFSDYLCMKFKILPYPISPMESLDENCWISDEWYEDSVAPWALSIDAEDFDVALDRHGKNRNKLAVIFDVSQPITKQLKAAEEILKYRIEKNNDPDDWPYIPDSNGNDDYQRISVRLNEYPKYLRILDAIAANSHLDDPELIRLLVDTFHPNEDDGYPACRVSKKIRKNIKAAKSLRDEKYHYLTIA